MRRGLRRYFPLELLDLVLRRRVSPDAKGIETIRTEKKPFQRHFLKES